MSSNNKTTRQILAEEFDSYSKKIKALTAKKKEVEEKLISKMETRGIDKELYDTGLTACVVRSTQKVTDKSLVAEKLGLTPEEYEEVLNDCSVKKDKRPYIKVT